MHLYSGSTIDFISDATQNRIAGKLEDTFLQAYRYKPPQSEVRSWQNSLRAMSTAVQTADLVDHGVIVEWQLPLTSRRLDCMITGRDPSRRPNAVVVELKQWEEAFSSPIEDCVEVEYGGRRKDVLHPSAQVRGYQRYLLDMHTTFSEAQVGLQACSYLHNFVRDPSSELFAAKHRDVLALCPLFAGDDLDGLVDHLAVQLAGGPGGDVLEAVLGGKARPHKRLLDHTARMIRNEPVYVLLDEQQVVFNSVLARIRARSLSTEPSVFLIKGGPGTGKSVIAVNLVAELSAQGFATHHATGSKAFTENLRKVVGSRASAQFGYFNSFTRSVEERLDALILDEAHRIRETSINRFTPKDQRTGRRQIDELLDVAKVTVFFIDDLQGVRPGEVGSTELIRFAAAERGVPVIEYELESQFRSNGSDAYVRWIENTLDLRRAPEVLFDPTDAFDFDVVDSPEELESLIRQRAAEGHTARLSAGFCWPWSNPRPDGSLVDDVVVGSWTKPWNAKPDAGRLAPGIPKSNFWANDPGGLEQVGCIYTAQGFEYDYAGVVFGRDLVYRARSGWVGQPEHSRDPAVRRAKGDEFQALVKNTYRVLLTRGLKGCYVYFQDEQTRDFVLSRLAMRS